MLDAAPARPRVPPVRRLLRRLRLAAALVILFGPIALGAWCVHVAPPALGSGPRSSADQRVAAYLARRHPVVDRLLPGGRGGTRFYEHLGGNDGIAKAGAAAIGLALTVNDRMWPESVELHERAHLLQAFADRLSAPAREQWSALWRAVEARRLADGTFQPWGARTIREYIAAERHMAASSGWLGRVASVVLLPSLLLASLGDVIG
jgi:hypothetical protein